ncbi:MAG: 23S rRNA methyltransferase [Pseudonocardiales bacterium]|nr:23S rRNA methyltransferase [Pseudonocardiales bacterium]
MLDDVIRYLRCPYCGVRVCRDGGLLRCAAGHVFDIARQGYVSLLPAGARGEHGDSAAMVQARADFLAAGHYAGIAAELARAAAEVVATLEAEGCVIDVGAGTGYYLAAVVDRLPDRVGLALDSSKFALRRAARAHERIGAVACDVWRLLPVVDSAAVVLLNIFAPRNGAELRRIINPAGRLLVVTPTRDHLGEFVQPLGLLTIDERKDERLAEKLTPCFNLVERWEHRSTLRLDHKGIAAVVAMGPSARHVNPDALAGRIAQLPNPMPTTVAVTLSTFRPSDP